MAHPSHQWPPPPPPPPPQYGGPAFHYQPHLQTPGQQQFPYKPSALSASVRQQYAYPPPINQSRFDVSTQIPSPNSGPPQYTSAGFNPALFHQFANSSLPPPPPPSYPPLPLPNGTLPPFIPPQITNHNFQNQYSPHRQYLAPSTQPQPYRNLGVLSQEKEQSTLPEVEKQQGMVMNDGELEDNRINPAPMSAQALEQNNNGSRTDMLQPQKADVSEPASSYRTDSVSSYNPPSATPPESGETVAELSSGVQTEFIEVGETSKYQGRAAFEMRELAKGALLSLTSHNIKFPELLAEGIDAQLLSELFEEVGIKTTAGMASSTPTAAKVSTVDQSAAQPTHRKTSSPNNLALKGQPRVNANGPTADEVLTSPTTSTVVRQQVSVPAPTTPAPCNTSDTQQSANPTMERKDVIAAMLAAKMGKPLPHRTSPGTELPGLPAKVTPAPPAMTLGISAPPPQTTLPTTTDKSSQPLADKPISQSTPKLRSKAQTELVRQKMEQLKRESMANARVQKASQQVSSPSASRSASTLPKAPSIISQGSLPCKPVSQEKFVDSTQNASVNDRRAVVTVSDTAPPLTATFTSSIPGLFMMEADPDPEIAHTPLQDSSNMAPSILDNTVVSEPSSSTEALRGAQSQQLKAIDLSPSIRESSGYRLSSKRPQANDASEEQDLPPMKRQDSRPTSSRELDSSLDDVSNDDISEGEIMDIDNESPISPLPRIPGFRLHPIPSGAIVAWPSIDSSASPNMSRQGIVSDVMQAKVDRTSETNGRRTTTISKTNVELEFTKKKLAEAEKRGTEKQSGSQLPATSSMDRPSMPTALSQSPVPAANAFPMTATRQEDSQHLAPIAQTDSQPSTNGTESRSPAPSVLVDSVQRAKELREKLLRQRLLKQGLPELDKEVQKTPNPRAEAQLRLAQLRREVEKREKEAREAREREQQIMEEVKRLEQQLEVGMNEQQQQLPQEVDRFNLGTSALIVSNAEQTPTTLPSVFLPSRVSAVPSEGVYGDSRDGTPQSIDDINKEPSEKDGAVKLRDSIPISEDEPDRQDHNACTVRPSAEAALPTAVEEATFLRAAMVDESITDEEGFASAEDSNQCNNADMTSRDNSQYDFDDSPMDVDSKSDASASMSDSGSEDYRPAEAILSTEETEVAVDEDEDDEYNPMDAPISDAQSPLAEEDQGDYEPSDVVEPLELRTFLSSTAQDQASSPVSNDAASENGTDHADDRKHSLELVEANTLTTPQDLLSPTADSANTHDDPRPSGLLTSRFTPYQSPLSNFKSYRFNAQFTDRIPDGYRSLTYSNAIDPTKPLCPTEAEGGTCTDVDCEEQHFRQMSLADEKILVQMSSANDIPDKAQRDSFVSGLKLIISDLRARHISDFDHVASELAAYRRRFRQEQDPSLAFTSDEL